MLTLTQPRSADSASWLAESWVAGAEDHATWPTLEAVDRPAEASRRTSSSPGSAAAELALELFVRDIDRSRRFYATLGFRVRRAGARFAEMVWEQSVLFLYQPPMTRWAHCGEVDDTPRTNLRVMVSEVEQVWERVLEQGIRVIEPLFDKPYGFRDFMIADPDGFGLRFASPIPVATRANDFGRK